jgi:hypothetical protein
VGLHVEYGYLASYRDDPDAVERFQRHLAAVNTVLRAEGLPEHTEPTEIARHTYRCGLDSIAWSWLHCLRRVHALYLQNGDNPQWRPEPASEDYPGPEVHPAVANELWDFRSHLIVHSDESGWYVPIDFKYTLYGDGTTEPPGRILGSSTRLLDELQSIAPWLGIPLGPDGDLDDVGVADLNTIDEDNPWWRERIAWFHLFEATRLSVALGTAVVFA